MNPNKQAFLDNLGYYPHALFLVYDAKNLNPKFEDRCLYSSRSRDECKKWMKENGYSLVINPRFSNFDNLVQEVEEFNNESK